MATKAGTPAATPRFSPQVVCSVFVEQYYNMLHATPDQVHKFYQDTSTMGRAGSDGVMEYVTTLPEINKKVMSVDYSQYVTEIVSAYAVSSQNGGVHIVVTGSSATSDGVYQRFTQSFFLAPQEGVGYSYFVRSDILRVMPETLPSAITQVVNQGRSGSSQDDGSGVGESREAEHVGTDHHLAVENEAGDWEVLHHIVDGPTAETNVNAEPPVQVIEEDQMETPVAAFPPPPEAPNEATIRSYVSSVTSLFSRLLNVM